MHRLALLTFFCLLCLSFKPLKDTKTPWSKHFLLEFPSEPFQIELGHDLCYVTTPSLLPKNKTILLISSKGSSFQLLNDLKNYNLVTTLSSKNIKEIYKTYHKIKPDIVILPIKTYKRLKSYKEKISCSLLFYPENTPSNFEIKLDAKILDEKKAHLGHPSKVIEVPDKESFFIKKLYLDKKGRIKIKNASHFSLRDLSNTDLLAYAKTNEDVYFGFEGLAYECKKEKLSIHLFTDHKKLVLTNSSASLAFILPSALTTIFSDASENAKLLKKIKAHYKSHPDKTIYLIYYYPFWKEEWNLYHYHPFKGSKVIAAFGEEKLKLSSKCLPIKGFVAENFLFKTP